MSWPADEVPLVSIGISTYERAAGTFPAALRSALAQTWPDLEVLVCDNASTDDTAEVVAQHADPRLRYHRHEENIGAHANFRFCVEASRGRYFVLLHDDDLLDADFVARCMAGFAERPDAGFAHGGVRVIDGEGEVTAYMPHRELGLTPAELFLAWFDRKVSFYLCSTMFHRRHLLDAGSFHSPKGLFQDVAALAILAGRHGHVDVPGIASSFRRHAANRGGTSRVEDWVEDSLFLLDVVCREMPERADELRAAGQPYLARKCYRYVAAAPTWSERARLAMEIYRRFDRSYGPWRFLAERWTAPLRRAVRKLRGATPASPDRTVSG